MRTDLLGENLVMLREVRSLLPVRPDRQTLNRWVAKGVTGADGRRHRLGAVRIGSRWYTSEQAVRRFVEATNRPATTA